MGFVVGCVLAVIVVAWILSGNDDDGSNDGMRAAIIIDSFERWH